MAGRAGHAAAGPLGSSAQDAQFRGAMRFDQPLQSVARTLERAGIAEQPQVVMCGEDDPEELEGELPGIGLRFEMPLVDGKADRLCNRAAQLALSGNEQVAHGSGAIVILDGGGEHQAAAWQIVVAFEPREPVREQVSETRQSLGLL